MSDFKTDELEPCLCGFKPDHYSIYYGQTPYCIWCPDCKKQTNFAKCLVTGHHDNVIDYWNKHISKLTLSQVQEEVKLFLAEKEAKRREEQFKSYNYYWQKGKGEVLRAYY